MSASSWYGASREATDIAPEVAERALEWLVCLQEDGASTDVVQDWTCWRAAHPDHERAWQRIELVQGHLRPLASPLHAAAARAALAPRVQPTRRRALKVLTVAALTGAGTAWHLRGDMAWQEWVADHRTEIGERRDLALPDGSRLVLNTNSAVDVLFSQTERRVRLIAGEILVTTARQRGDARPFLVETAQGTARALGTEFSVLREDDRTAVSVFDGAVQLQPRRHSAQTRILQAGHRASYWVLGVSEPDPADEDSIAWREGYIVARSMRLDELVAQLDRYSRAELSCDPSVAAMRVSGSFPLDDIRKVMTVVAATLQLRLSKHDSFWSGRRVRLVP